MLKWDTSHNYTYGEDNDDAEPDEMTGVQVMAQAEGTMRDKPIVIEIQQYHDNFGRSYSWMAVPKGANWYAAVECGETYFTEDQAKEDAERWYSDPRKYWRSA